ncbi:MAG: HAD hydrolase family protein [Lachnospiraceae bacterium]
MDKENYKLPKIGLRIIKSAIGVFLCYVVNLLRNGQGIVFYSQLAVLWCMQDYVSETKAKAKQRSLGTLVGALFGLVYIVLEQFFGKYLYDLIKVPDNLIAVLFRGLTIALFIIIVLYTTVLMNKKQASYFSCVVFLSIVVNHISDSNPYLFVWNRFLDTMIGIVLGIVVNTFSLPRKKHPEILFVSGLDDTLLSKQNNISDYGRVELNRMLDDGLTFTLSTIRTPASLMEPMRDIRLKLPVIAMDGAALFNLKEKRYELVYVISSELSQKLVDFFKKIEEPCFINVVVDDLLMIYYEETSLEIYNTIVNSLRSSPYRNYIKRPLPKEEDVVYFMLIDDKEKMQGIYDALMKEDFVRDLKVLFYDSTDYAGKAYIKIYNHNASKENMLEYLKRRLEIDRTVTFGTIPNRYDYTIMPGDSNNLIRQIKRRFEPYAWKKS